MNPTPKPPVKPQSLASDLTPEAIVALAWAFPNMTVEKIMELHATLTGASGTLAPHPSIPALSAAMSQAPPPGKEAKDDHTRPIKEDLFFFFVQIYLTWCSNTVHAHTKYIVQVKKKRKQENCTWL
jgi:hypothetical protein